MHLPDALELERPPLNVSVAVRPCLLLAGAALLGSIPSLQAPSVVSEPLAGSIDVFCPPRSSFLAPWRSPTAASEP